MFVRWHVRCVFSTRNLCIYLSIYLPRGHPPCQDGALELARAWRDGPTLMANPLGDLLEWLFAANITTSDAFASAKALIEANVTRESLQKVAQPMLYLA